ncbi:MAG: GNAT family N-acetyltransferase [Clostridioides sp.]|jgi:ribosomal protein S18 acetylase RimI-like enzyme|nr:GNAT family N-acetyltransferase [Clostridioides sp.]
MNNVVELSVDELPWDLLLQADPDEDIIKSYIYETRIYVFYVSKEEGNEVHEVYEDGKLEEVREVHLIHEDSSVDRVNGVDGANEEGNKVVGVLAVKKLSGDANYELMNIAVNNRFQRRGIARKLILRAFSDMDLESVVTVRTGDISTEAVNLYESLGFVVVKTVENYFLDNYSEVIYEHGEVLKHQLIMEKTII